MHTLVGGVSLVKIFFNKQMKLSKCREAQHCPAGSPQHFGILPVMAPQGSETFSEELVKAHIHSPAQVATQKQSPVQELPNVRKLKIWVPMS